MSDGPGDRRAVPPRVVLLAGAVIALGVVLGVVIAAGAGPYHALSNSDPGAVVRTSAAVLRIGADLAAAGCVGSLAFVALCTAPQHTGLVSPGGYRALSGATRWAALWLVLVLLLVPVETADSAGQPLSQVLRGPGFRALFVASEAPKAWLVTAVLLVGVLLGGRLALRWRSAVGVLVLALVAVLPPLAVGHSASEADHDLATDAIMLHAPAAVLWLGVVVAYLRYRRYAGVPTAELTRRYARITGVCWWVTALAGVVDALVLIRPRQLVSTGYGALVLAAVVLLVGLGVLGRMARRRWGSPTRGGALRLVGLEALALAVAAGVSVALTRLAPPAFLDYRSAITTQLIGYDLTGPPSAAHLAGDWRPDLIFGPLAVLLAIGYLVALRRGDGRWPVSRTIGWLAGCLLLLVVTSSGIGRYAAATFSGHMLRHMLMGMVVPVLLALGGPLTLLQRVRPARTGRVLPGLADWCALVRDSALGRWLTHPAVALLLFAGSPFLLYDTGLFDHAVRFHWAHQALDGYFLAVGYLFAWLTVGVDATVHRIPSLARAGLLLAAMPADVLLAATVLNTDRIIGNGAAGYNFYTAVAVPGLSSLAADQRTAGLIALVVGEAALLLALAALLPRWSPSGETDPGAALISDHRGRVESGRS